MRGGRRAVTIGFYATLVVLLVAILFKVLPYVLPDAVANRIAHNSEGVGLVLILAPWIQFVRPRLEGSPRKWPITVAAAASPRCFSRRSRSTWSSAASSIHEPGSCRGTASSGTPSWSPLP